MTTNRDATRPADDRSILILRGEEVESALDGRESEIIDVVQEAYEIHARGDSSLPDSNFLRFPSDPNNRIIALPAYIGESIDLAGIKWVASFPANIDRGIDRASAVLILNSAQTGQPFAIVEASVINAKRTAASAALAARHLHADSADTLGVIGCGRINFEIVRFLRSVFPALERLHLHDLSRERAELFAHKCRSAFGPMDVDYAASTEDVLTACTLHTFGTTASTPHVDADVRLPPGSTLLHISLRDLDPNLIRRVDNVVDGIDHVCAAQTSVHLAEQAFETRDFIRCTIADVTSGAAPPRRADADPVVFSPFGMGILDLVTGDVAYEHAVEQGMGTRIPAFLAPPWAQVSDTASP